MGFYLQAFSNILPQSHEENSGRANSASLSFGLLVAFWLGIDITSLALEAPVLVALITSVSLPAIVHSASHASVGSLLAVTILYAAGMMSVLFGGINGWYRGSYQCEVASGFSGENALSANGKAVWFTLFGVETLLSLALLVIILYRMYATRNKRHFRAWFQNNRRNSLIFFWFSALVVVLCIVSVETTITRNTIQIPGLSESQYGQWIAFSVGLGAIISVAWGWLSRAPGESQHQSTTDSAGETDGEAGKSQDRLKLESIDGEAGVQDPSGTGSLSVKSEEPRVEMSNNLQRNPPLLKARTV